MYELKGCIPAMITPFREDYSPDLDGVIELADYFIECGVDGLLVCGTTGESATMTHKEDLSVIKTVVDHVDARVPVIAGTGSNVTKDAILYSKDAEELGVDAVLVVSPYYNKPPQWCLIKHYTAIAESIDIPLILYHVPGRTGGKGISADTVIELSRVENIIGVKWASSDLDSVKKIIEGADDGFSLVSGEDGLTFDMMKLGAKGAIAATGNIVPRQYSDMVHLMAEGKEDQARELHEKYVLPAAKLAFMADTVNPQVAKTALGLLGKPSGAFRPPLYRLPPELEDKVRAGLQKMGLIG